VTSILGIGTELLRLRGVGQGWFDISPLAMPFSLLKKATSLPTPKQQQLVLIILQKQNVK
jgi:hypothetical protein